jgi:hypothetical protein
MHSALAQRQRKSLLDDPQTVRKLEFNFRRNAEQDHTALLDKAARDFRYDDCRDRYWNPEPFSLLYGTPLWEQATAAQRIALNQLYWVAYYSQIISAEIATIYYNHVAATGLYGLEDFRLVCDALDLETRQERAHVNALKRIGEEVEATLIGGRIFTYPMRSPFAHTMVAYTMMSANNAFLASHYLLVRGLRTLNGKIVQHKLSRFYADDPDKDHAPLPSAVSYYHFMDESHHFNTSRIIGLDVPRSLEAPTAFERWIVNRGIAGCQRDHFWFSILVNGIFWCDAAAFDAVYRLFRSKLFGFDHGGALAMMRACFADETDALHASRETHRTAVESYRAFVEGVAHLTPANREMRRMAASDVPTYLARNRRALARFKTAA